MQISINLEDGYSVFSICTSDKKCTWHQKMSNKTEHQMLMVSLESLSVVGGEGDTLW